MKRKKSLRSRLKLLLFLGVVISLVLLGNVGLNSIYNTDVNTNDRDFVLDGFDINPRTSAQNSAEWLDNPTFDLPIDPWYNTTEGDITDVNASASGGEAKYEIIGESRTFSFVEDPPQASSWTETANPDFPAPPDNVDIPTGEGCYVDHYWDEGADQSVGINWDHNFTMPVNMSDYEITSASLSAVVNGTVTVLSEQWYSDGVDVLADSTVDPGNFQGATGDNVRFFVLLSDLEKIKEYEVASYQSTELGQDSTNNDTLPDTYMVPVTEESLMFYLTSVLNTDNYNFTLSLGLRIWCEDNFPQDSDEWQSLYINSINLTFTYEKKIDQFSSIAWTQVGNQINGTNYRIDSAILNFKYKTDNIWPTSRSPNSEMRVLLNNYEHVETINLGNANSTFQWAKSGGFDVTSITQTDVNITVSIQLIILDEFELDNKITISIDDITLNITYTSIAPEEPTDCHVYLNSVNSLQTEVTIGENVNISCRYEDSIDSYISGATVQIDVGGEIKLLNATASFEIYNISIDSITLNIGTNYIYLTASKTDYVTKELTLIIIVNPKDTELTLFLEQEDKTSEKAVDVTYGESVNITITYEDIENPPGIHISDASVLLLGAGDPQNLTENPTLEYYNITVDSTSLGIGITFLTINAQKDNHTTQNIVFKCEVLTRETYIDNVFINNTETQTFEALWNENFNITINYNDTITNASISGATLQIEGTGYFANFTEDSGNDLYWITIDTSAFTIGVKYLTISAQKENYSIATQLVVITVNERETDMDVYLNQTIRYSIDINWNEELNITIKYTDSEDNFIDNATVSLKEGDIILENFIEYSSYYTLLYNTSEFDIGLKSLSIYANKDNFTVSIKNILINVIERETILTLYLNSSIQSSIEIAHGELLNITALYYDANIPTSFLNEADVSLKDGNTILYNFTRYLSLNQYNLTFNVGDLGLGVSALSVYAKLDNYTIALSNILINVIERESELTTYLNGTLGNTIEIAHGEILNITALFYDANIPTSFLDGADVSLKDGNTILYNFTRYLSLNQYNLSINVGDLGLGVSVLSIYAKLDNYTAALSNILINVIERESDITVYLNNISRNSLEIAHGELLNITALYFDANILTSFLIGANVSLKEGNTILYEITEIPSLSQYSLIINTAELGLGVRTLSIYANLDNFSAALSNILINVIERESELYIYLNGALENSIEIDHGETLNITALFYDKNIPTTFLDGADVNLREGTTVLYNFTRYLSLNQYNLTINSDSLSLGLNILTIYAKKDNFSASLETISITVNERDTFLEILLNDLDKTDDKSISLTSGELLNISVYYKDSSLNTTIGSATVQLLGENMTELFNATYDYYNFTLDTALLDIGVSFLSISANRNNYIQISEVITIIVGEKAASYELFLNNINKTIDRTISLTVNQALNVTLFYRDNINMTHHLTGANISLYGGPITEFLTENYSLKLYSIVINTSDLDQGVNFLNIFAQKDKYESLAVLFTINMIERETTLAIKYNGTDITDTPSIKVPVNEFINFTAIYNDNITGFHIYNASLRLFGETLEYNFNESVDYYSLIVNTEELNRGVNFLTVYAQRNNYEPHSIIITIEIIDKASELEIFLNSANKTQEKALDLPIGTNLNVTIQYLEYNISYLIPNATITILGEGLSKNLTYYPSLGYYSSTINTSQLDIGIRLLTLIAEKNNYQTISLTLRINVLRITTNITTTSGEPNIEVEKGVNPKLEVVLNDIDFNTTVTNATVQYSWIYGTGTLEDENGDGIYEVYLEDAPPGTYTVTVTAYAGDDYAFERYQVTVTVNKPTTTGGDNPFFAIFLVTLISLICVAGYAALYQKKLKIPKQIRKLRKFRKTLKRHKGVENIDIVGRREAIDEMYDGFITKVSKSLSKKEADEGATSLVTEDIAFHTNK